MKAQFRKLAGEVRQSLRSGQLKAGDLLPSTRQVAAQWGVHRHTVMAAYDELVAEGWLESHPGQGYKVATDWVEAQTQTPSAEQFNWDFGHELAASPELHRTAARYRFPSGQPDLRIFPHEEYYTQVRQALRRCAADDLLGYSNPAGRPYFCEQLGHYLRRARGLKFSPEELVVTHGCQEAIYLVARCWLQAGDIVAVEEQGFAKTWEAFRCCGAELAPIKIDDQGILPESLEQAMRTQKVRLLYLTPLHQYPTTVTLTPTRRQQVLQLAQQYQVPILEDDYDFEFHYQGTTQPPLKVQDSHGLVAYCSTFSKVLHPSARLGFVIAPAPLAQRVARLKTVVSRQNDNLAQEALAGWMAEGGFERHLRRMRRHYETRRRAMAQALAAWDPAPPIRLPQGGMCFWLDTGVDTQKLAELAGLDGVEVRPGSAYRLDGKSSSFLRLGFAHPTVQEIQEGLALLGRARAALL
ncbi:PLP-dependent aminotransferase family protein [bacterium]|nr:PLP-dependent aminotransferase family protein [bacterium]